MTTVLRVTAKDTLAAALIEVTGAPAGPLTIMRTDVNGTNPVRLLDGQEPISGSLTVYDYEVALQGEAVYEIVGDRTNQIANPSFEVNTTGWSNGTSAVITRDTVSPISGTASLRVDTTVQFGYAQYLTKVTVPAELRSDSTSVTLTVYAKGSGTLKVEARGQDASNLTTKTASQEFTLTGTAQRFSVTVNIDASTTKIWPLFFQQNAGTLSFWIDDVQTEFTSEPWLSFITGTVAGQPITDSVTMNVADPIIMTAVLPNNAQNLIAVTTYGSDRDFGGTVHWVTDRDDPIVVTGPLRLRSGSLSVYAPTYADARLIEAVAGSGEAILLRQPDYPGMDMYFIGMSASIQPRSTNTDPRRWEVSFRYNEVRIPEGALLGAAGWNFDVMEATYETFNDLEAAFSNFNKLAVGP